MTLLEAMDVAYATILSLGYSDTTWIDRGLADVSAPWGEGPSDVETQEELSEFDVGPTSRKGPDG